MKTLFLVRHAKSSLDEVALSTRERTLAERGQPGRVPHAPIIVGYPQEAHLTDVRLIHIAPQPDMIQIAERKDWHSSPGKLTELGLAHRDDAVEGRAQHRTR